MSKKKSPVLYFVAYILVFVSLSCSLFGRETKRDEPAETVRRVLIRQWANYSDASSEYDNPDWGAQQATGAPDTPECGDTPTA